MTQNTLKMSQLKQKVQKKFRLKNISEIKMCRGERQKGRERLSSLNFPQALPNTHFKFTRADQTTISIQLSIKFHLHLVSLVVQHQNTYNKKTLVAFVDHFSLKNNSRIIISSTITFIANNCLFFPQK